MTAFLLICNPVDVWDFRAFFASDPEQGYWCVTKKAFQAGTPGDRLYLRVTSKDKEPGIHGRFILKSKYKGRVPSEHWQAGRTPERPAEQFVFDIPKPVLLTPYLPVAILKVAFKSDSRLIRTPQSLCTEISEEEADEVDQLIANQG